MSGQENGDYPMPAAVLHGVIDDHRIHGAHWCACGWEGDSPTTHIIDMLGIRHVGWLNPNAHPGWELRPHQQTADDEPVFLIAGTNGSSS